MKWNFIFSSFVFNNHYSLRYQMPIIKGVFHIDLSTRRGSTFGPHLASKQRNAKQSCTANTATNNPDRDENGGTEGAMELRLHQLLEGGVLLHHQDVARLGNHAAQALHAFRHQHS